MMAKMIEKLRGLWQRYDRLGFRLAVVLAVALLPLMIVSIVRSQSVLSEAAARSRAALAGETLKSVQREVSLIENAKGAAQALSRLVPGLLNDPLACNLLMKEFLVDTPYTFAGYYDLTGFVPCSSAPEPFSFGANPALEAQIADPRPTVLVNKAALVSGTSVIYASYPVYTADGILQGFAAVSVPHYALISSDQAALGGATFLTLKPDETILTGPDPIGNEQLLLPVMGPGETILDLPGSFSRLGRDGVRRRYVVVPVIEGELYALGMWTSADQLRGDFYLSNPSFFPALMWLGSLVVAWFASSLFVTRHVLHLRQAMRDFARKRRIAVVEDFSGAPGELRDVAADFVGMTERILREEAGLEDLVRQKDILLREVHHRVKNNLQLIASIMSLQTRQSTSPEVRRLMRGLHNRVTSLATIHRELYQTSGQADVIIDELLMSIVKQVMRMGTQHGDINLHTDLAPLKLNPDQAVPLSLFVTEALTNALKYIGAPGGQSPDLHVVLRQPDEDHAEIEVTNSLADRPDMQDGEKSSGLGSVLMVAFAEQLSGEFQRSHDDHSFTVRLRFPVEELAGKEIPAA